MIMAKKRILKPSVDGYTTDEAAINLELMVENIVSAMTLALEPDEKINS